MQMRMGEIAQLPPPPNPPPPPPPRPRRNRDTALLHMGIESVDAWCLADEDIVAAEIIRLMQRRWRLERNALIHAVMQANHRPGGDGINWRAEIWILCVCAAITLVEAVAVDADMVDGEGGLLDSWCKSFPTAASCERGADRRRRGRTWHA